MMIQTMKRLPGIDLLKIVSMYLIVLLHVVQHGGGVKSSAKWFYTVLDHVVNRDNSILCS